MSHGGSLTVVSLLGADDADSSTHFLQDWQENQRSIWQSADFVEGCSLYAANESRPHPLVPSLEPIAFDHVEIVRIKGKAAADAANLVSQVWPSIKTPLLHRRAFLVSESQMVSNELDGASDQALSFVKRKPNATDEQFLNEWNIHGTMAAKVRYLQEFSMLPVVHAFEPEGRLLADRVVFDGFAMSRWDTRRTPLAEAPERQAWFEHGATFLGSVSNYTLQRKS
jgi:hypothetical protein